MLLNLFIYFKFILLICLSFGSFEKSVQAQPICVEQVNIDQRIRPFRIHSLISSNRGLYALSRVSGHNAIYVLKYDREKKEFVYLSMLFSLGDDNDLGKLAYSPFSNALFLTLSGDLFRSVDGISWTKVVISTRDETIDLKSGIAKIQISPNQKMMLAEYGISMSHQSTAVLISSLIISFDEGLTWERFFKTPLTIPPYENWFDIRFGPNQSVYFLSTGGYCENCGNLDQVNYMRSGVIDRDLGIFEQTRMVLPVSKSAGYPSYLHLDSNGNIVQNKGSNLIIGNVLNNSGDLRIGQTLNDEIKSWLDVDKAFLCGTSDLAGNYFSGLGDTVYYGNVNLPGSDFRIKSPGSWNLGRWCWTAVYDEVSERAFLGGEYGGIISAGKCGP
jgi:hypothetical protein